MDSVSVSYRPVHRVRFSSDTERERDTDSSEGESIAGSPRNKSWLEESVRVKILRKKYPHTEAGAAMLAHGSVASSNSAESEDVS